MPRLDTPMTFQIECCVYGGLTGNRTGILKENGREYETDDRSAAETKAAELTATMNSMKGRTANFNYRVIEL